VLGVVKNERQCNICEEVKPVEEFEKNPQRPLGHGYRCNPCNRQRRRDAYRDGTKDRPLADCAHCGEEYRQANKNHLTCSTRCSNFLRFNTNEHKYITSLLTKQRREDGLTREHIEELLEEQGGMCALSGEPLTFIRGAGSVATNASLDRIEAGGTYAKENVQIVCSAVNSFRRDLSIEEYVEWCCKVAKTNRVAV